MLTIDKVYEASKARFINKMDGDEETKSLLIDWVDNKGGDSYLKGYGWNQNDKNNDIFALLSHYEIYKIDKGGTRKEKKTAKRYDPFLIFKKLEQEFDLLILDDRDENLEYHEFDFALLHNLTEYRNDGFAYVQVNSHKAAQICNEFYCGGGGAQWCIGMETDHFWYDYTKIHGCKFIMAINKKLY